MLNGVSLQSWSPLARGLYSGRILDDKTAETVKKTTEIVNRMAEAKDVSADGIVLAWLMKHPGRINPVIGSKTPERIKKAMDAFKVELTRDEWYELLVASKGQNMP
jgi:predicted oxidoreductase